MRNYLDLMALVLTRGTRRADRTNTGTLSLFGPQMEFDLSAGFPLMTTKRLHWKSIVHELLWFLSGDTNIRYLKENGVTIWNEWADADGELGPVYGHQWRNWARFERVGEGSDHYRKVSIDQIERLVHGLKNAPESRRHLVSAWNVSDVEDMALPPCHALWQCYVADGKLSMKLYQRSADVFLGVPFNIASYSLLTHMLAQQCDLEVGRFIWSGGDTHIYLNHLAQAHQQLKRVPKQLPRLRILRKPDDIFSYRFEDFVVEGYDADPNIPAPVAV